MLLVILVLLLGSGSFLLTIATLVLPIFNKTRLNRMEWVKRILLNLIAYSILYVATSYVLGLHLPVWFD